MSARVKLVIFWGAIVALIIVGMNFIRHLFRGYYCFSGRPGGFRQGGMMGNQGGMMGPHVGFRRHAYMYGIHHGGFHFFGFLLFLIIAIAIVIFILRGLRRKMKDFSLKQWMDTPFTSSHTPVSSMNGDILDQWEKSLNEKKENKENGNI